MECVENLMLWVENEKFWLENVIMWEVFKNF